MTTLLAESEDLALMSLICVLGALATVIVPVVLLVKLPFDHFTRAGLARERTRNLLHPNLRVVRSVFGLVLIGAGIAMLALPGPGLLMILLGLVLADFPGKHKGEHWLLSHRSIRDLANRVRRTFHQPPFEVA